MIYQDAFVAVLMSVQAAASDANPITVTPRAIGEPDKSFTASSIGFRPMQRFSISLRRAVFLRWAGEHFRIFIILTPITLSGKTGFSQHYILSASFHAVGTQPLHLRGSPQPSAASIFRFLRITP